MFSPHMLTLNDLLIFLGIFAGSALLALVATHYMIGQFAKWQIIADANERSMHSAPVPVGGGWAIVAVVLLAGMAVFWPISDKLLGAVLLATLVLALLSWMDDRQHMNQLVRLSIQALAIAAVLILTPDNKMVFSNSWPLWADRILTGLCWLWFVNLFNFMDGIDGIAGTQILFICTGFVVIGLATGFAMPTLHMTTALAGATAGFLWWNWPPARIFLGDVGSISIGFLLGWLLIQLAMQGHLIAAFLLPAYFVTDASVTMLKRILKGEAFWTPHKTHYYQRAAMGLGSHIAALWKIIPAYFGLLAFAILSIYQPLLSALCGAGVLAGLFFSLERCAKNKS